MKAIHPEINEIVITLILFSISNHHKTKYQNIYFEPKGVHYLYPIIFRILIGL